MNNNFLQLHSHLVQRVYQHHIQPSNLFDSFHFPSNFFTNPNIQISSDSSLQQLSQITIDKKKKIYQTQHIKKQYIILPTTPPTPSSYLQQKITSYYKQIHLLLKIKFYNNDKTNTCQESKYFKTQRFSLIIDNKRQQFTIASNIYDSISQAEEFHNQYLKVIEQLQDYVPQTYAYYINYTRKEKVCLTYLVEYYESFEQISRHYFRNDSESDIENMCSILESKNKSLKENNYAKKLKIGLTIRSLSIKWLPFQELEQPITIHQIYKANFHSNYKSQLNIKSLNTFFRRKQKLKNMLYYYSEELPSAVSQHKKEGQKQSQGQNQPTFIYSLNNELIKLKVKQGQKYSNFYQFSEDKRIISHSQTQYIKVLRGSSVKVLAYNRLREFIMTKYFSNLQISEDLYWFKQNFDIYCYFTINKYIKILQVFSKSKQLFQNTQTTEQISEQNISCPTKSTNIDEKQTQSKRLETIISQISADIKQQLNILHIKNVIHGDVSLHNIVYDLSVKKFKLIDFEMAERINEEIGQKTYIPNGEGFGTPKYMSKQMKLILQKKLDFIDLYKNDMDCLTNVINFLKKHFKLNGQKTL